MVLPDPNILDVTVRDGSFLINHQFRPEDVAKIATSLTKAGIRYAEVSHGCGIGARSMGFSGLVDDDELLEAVQKAAPDLKLSIFISPVENSLPLIPALLPFFKLGRVGVNANDVEQGKKHIEKLKKYEKQVSVQLVRSHACPPEVIAKSAQQCGDLGADIVYLVDTFGSMMPHEVKEYIEAIKSGAKAQVGFHGHNNMGMAVPNTLAAFEAGATWLDASLMGEGKGAGNASLETLIFHLQSRQICQEVNLKTLCQASEKVITPLFESPPVCKYIDLLFSLEKIDFFSPQLIELLATYLHLPLDSFLTDLHAKMGNEIALGDQHLKAVLQEHGVDFEKVVHALTGNKPNAKCQDGNSPSKNH